MDIKFERSYHHLTFSLVRPNYQQIFTIVPASVRRNAQGAFPCKNPIKQENGVKNEISID